MRLLIIALIMAFVIGCSTVVDTGCKSDTDCSCGTHVDTGECYFGPKDLVDETKQCPDFCSGIAGHLEIKCVEGECKQMQKGFCGSSTNAACSDDSGCKKGGCSGQVCQGSSEEDTVTTCIFKECYDATKFGVRCGCFNDQCSWG